jgi:hypothetical protein
MAKTKAISYGPNTALIQGEGLVARSEALASGAGGTALVKSLTSAVTSGIEEKIKEQEERNAKMDDHLDKLGGVQNIGLLDEDYNKQAVTDFVRNGRDEYAKLAADYEKSGDRSILDKMEAIKFSFNNLNTQLKALAKDKVDYLSAYDDGQLVTLGNGDERFTDMYTNNSLFSIESNGDIGFGAGDDYNRFKDVAGKWNVKSNIGETFVLKQSLDARKRGETGKAFYKNDTKNLYLSTFKQTGPEGIMVMAKTDLTGDNEYILPNGEKAGNMSFESMWSQGFLDDKFYKVFPKGTDSSWMYDKANVNVLNDIMSEYYADVTEYSYNESKSIFDAKSRVVTSKKAPAIVATQEDFPETNVSDPVSEIMASFNDAITPKTDVENTESTSKKPTETSNEPLTVPRKTGGYGIGALITHKDKGRLIVVEINDKDQLIAEDEAGNKHTLTVTK